MHSAIKSNIGNEFLRGGETMNITDMSYESSGAYGADPGDGLEKFLLILLSGFHSFLHLFEGFLKRGTESGECTVEFFFCCLLVGILDTYEILAFGFKFCESCVFTEECFEFENLRSICKEIAMTLDEDVSDGRGVSFIILHRAEGCLDGFGCDVWIYYDYVPSMICEEDTKEEMVDVGGFKTDFDGIFVVPMV